MFMRRIFYRNPFNNTLERGILLQLLTDKLCTCSTYAYVQDIHTGKKYKVDWNTVYDE